MLATLLAATLVAARPLDIYLHACEKRYDFALIDDPFDLAVHRAGKLLCARAPALDGSSKPIFPLFAPSVRAMRLKPANDAVRLVASMPCGFLLRGPFPRAVNDIDTVDLALLRRNINTAIAEEQLTPPWAVRELSLHVVSLLSFSRRFGFEGAASAKAALARLTRAKRGANRRTPTPTPADSDADDERIEKDDVRLLNEIHVIGNASLAGERVKLTYFPMIGSNFITDKGDDAFLQRQLESDLNWHRDRPHLIPPLLDSLMQCDESGAPKLVYVHCEGGFDRTGAAIATYMLAHNVSLVDTLMLSALFKSADATGLTVARSSASQAKIVTWPSNSHMKTIRWFWRHLMFHRQRQRNQSIVATLS
jgi:hypothetical protein